MSMHFLRAVAVLGGLFVVFPALLFFGLRWLVQPLIRSRAASRVFSTITTVGYLFYGCQVLFFLACSVAYELDPTGRLGSALQSPNGTMATMLIAVLGFSAIAAVLTRLGYPLLRRQAQRNV
jgi:uncharacterized membrane protein YesL